MWNGVSLFRSSDENFCFLQASLFLFMKLLINLVETHMLKNTFELKTCWLYFCLDPALARCGDWRLTSLRPRNLHLWYERRVRIEEWASLCWHSGAQGLTSKMEKVAYISQYQLWYKHYSLTLPILQNALVTTYDCGDIVTTFLHKETKLTRRKFEWVEHNILEFLVKTFCIPLLWWFKGNVEYLTLNFFVIKLLTLRI